MLDGTGSAVRPARVSSLTGSSPAGTALPAATLRPAGSSPAGSSRSAGPSPVAGARPAAAAAGFVPPDDEPGGLVVSWTGGVGIGPVLAASHRCARHRAGLDLPAWGEVGSAGASEGRPVGEPEAGPQDDELGEEALRAATEGRGRVLSAAVLGSHAIMAPGPDLAGWLACGQAADRDDAALVNSITAWRKVTSWAQAQELAAVTELARRRGVPGARDASGEDCDRAADAGDRDPAADAGREEHDPVAELEAGFAPNEVALALTLTQGGAEYWMDLAVSLSRRLPATLAALGEGTIDLNRAKLIDQFTGSLDIDYARAVERRVLVRAQHQTSGQLRASLQRAVLAADPAAAERRRQQVEARAWVALSGDHDGTASLSGRCLPAAQTAAAWARICAMAKAMEAAGAGGGMDLLRAQVFVGLLLGTLPLVPPADAGPDDAGPDDGGPDHAGPEDTGRDGGSPDDSSLDDAGPDHAGRDGGGPGDRSLDNAGPDHAGGDGGRPDDRSLDNAGRDGGSPDNKYPDRGEWDDSAPEDSVSENSASEDSALEGRGLEGRGLEGCGREGHDGERSAYEGGAPVGSGHDSLGRGLVRSDDGDSAREGKASARDPADTTADGPLPSPAWPPPPGRAPPRPLAVPARPARARPAPETGVARREAHARGEARAHPGTPAHPVARPRPETRVQPGTQPQTHAHAWPAGPCSACRGGLWPGGAPSPANWAGSARSRPGWRVKWPWPRRRM
jgi:Domain of unknown function (DUF222)